MQEQLPDAQERRLGRRSRRGPRQLLLRCPTFDHPWSSTSSILGLVPRASMPSEGFLLERLVDDVRRCSLIRPRFAPSMALTLRASFAVRNRPIDCSGYLLPEGEGLAELRR